MVKKKTKPRINDGLKDPCVFFQNSVTYSSIQQLFIEISLYVIITYNTTFHCLVETCLDGDKAMNKNLGCYKA